MLLKAIPGTLETIETKLSKRQRNRKKMYYTTAAHREASEPMAFEDLYSTMQRPLLAHLTRLVSDREVAEDLCQESFLKALRAWGQRDHHASAAAWLFRIATNTAYDYLRRRRRIAFMPLLEGDAPPSGAPTMEARLDDGAEVRQALELLPPIYRVPLVLHECEGHSTQEIAHVLGCSAGAVKTRLFRARERFRQVYRSDEAITC